MGSSSVGRQLHDVIARLEEATGTLRFEPPVTHVYAPLEYAAEAVGQYVDRYARRGVEALLLGMNPGPWGMVQTGIPFGEVQHVRGYLGISGPVHAPREQHPKRPVDGLDCTRSEVSGRRLWSWVASRFPDPDRFFDRFFVWNWCPLAFLEETGRNRTPDKLPVAERRPLEAICDEALRELVELLEPRRVIGVGGFARKRASLVLGPDLPVDTILHPSPASPAANRGWAPQVEVQLREMGVELGPAAVPSAD